MLSGIVSVSANSPTADEGNQAPFTISGTDLSASGVQVYYQTTPGTATSGSDYTHISGSVFLSQSSPSATINVSTIADGVVDPNETFSLALVGVMGSASIGTGSATVTINEPSTPPPGPNPEYIQLQSPGNLNEGQAFYLLGQVLPPASYSLSGNVNWGGFITEIGGGFSLTTSSDGTFSIANKYFDNGVSPGNDTPSDLANIVMTATVNGTTQLTGTTTATIHNVSPLGSISVLPYMPMGGPNWQLNGSFSDLGIADVHTISIDWGDESNPTVLNNVPMGSFSSIHTYPLTGETFTITVTVADDDTGAWSNTVSFVSNRVSADDVIVEWQKPDGSWQLQPENEVMWDDDTLRWKTILSGNAASYVHRLEWYKRPFGTAEPWQMFAAIDSTNPVVAHPGVGDWAVTVKPIAFGVAGVWAAAEEKPILEYAELRWIKGADEQRLLGDGDGQKVYPESNSAEPGSPIFNVVKIEAEVKALVPVGFVARNFTKVFDPDHVFNPSAENQVGFDPNDDDNDDIPAFTPDREPNDNRAPGAVDASAPGGIKFALSTPGGNLAAESFEIPAGERIGSVAFTITAPQPGNNFRAAVNGRKEWLDLAVFAADATNLLKRAGGHPYAAERRTKILTVWRIERDSMGPTNPAADGPFDGMPGADDDPDPGNSPDPDIGLLAPEFARANIDVVADLQPHDPDDNTFFMHYIDMATPAGRGAFWTAASDLRDVRNDSSFWVTLQPSEVLVGSGGSWPVVAS